MKYNEINNNEKKAILKLFNAVLKKDITNNNNNIKINGLKDRILINSNNADENDLANMKEIYALKIEELNNTFHKSFATVRDSSLETLIIQQLIHYFSTYGLESLGIDNGGSIYVPYEKLEIPDVISNIPLIVIGEITTDELKNKLNLMINSGIAFSEETIDDIIQLSEFIDISKIDEIKNKEIKIRLYAKYNLVPKNNIEFLRYLIFKLTDKTLLINNKETYNKLKLANKNDILKYLKEYLKDNDIVELAKIFLRYKNLFLALKRNDFDQTSKDVNKIINRIAKLSKKYHEKANTKLLDTLYYPNLYCSDIKESDYTKKLIQELNKITFFKEITLYNNLKYRLNIKRNNVFKIRNGKIFVDNDRDSENDKVNKIRLESILNVISNNLIYKLQDKVKGKTFYIPENIDYVVPSSEKQFLGSIPFGSSINIPRDSNIIIAIHWNNLKNKKTDLDLKGILDGKVIGWDYDYRDDNILFSGDMTDASNGATEAILIKEKADFNNILITLNNYSQSKENVPFDIIIAKSDNDQINKNCIINPNDIIFKTTSVIESDKSSKTLGSIKIEEENIKFVLNELCFGNQKTTSTNEITIQLKDYYNNFSKIQLKLKDLIQMSGGIIKNKSSIISTFYKIKDDMDGEPLYKEIKTKVDYDFSINKLEKDSFINLFNNIYKD